MKNKKTTHGHLSAYPFWLQESYVSSPVDLWGGKSLSKMPQWLPPHNAYILFFTPSVVSHLQ